MTDKLGFTFYPKDWWSSDSFFELEPKEKYIYLECLFLMYMNDGYMNYSKEQIEKRFSVKLSDDEFNRIVSRFIKDEQGYTSLTVNKRMSKAISSRENGKLGGRPKKAENEAEEKPKKPNEKTQNNPPSEREKKEKEKKKLNEAKNSPHTQIDFDVRVEKFRVELIQYVDVYGKEMVRKFFDYWREPNKSKTKMRWEQERTWDLSLRLKKWESNQFAYSKSKLETIEYTTKTMVM